MKRFMIFLFILFMFTNVYAKTVHMDKDPEIHMTPEDLSSFVVREINNAKVSIRMLCYSFTDQDIADALIKAHNNGIDVQIIADRSQLYQKDSLVLYCYKKGIPLYLNTKYKIAHDKVFIYDTDIVITGSFNPTYSANHFNSENIVILFSKDANDFYTGKWGERLKVANKYGK